MLDKTTRLRLRRKYKRSRQQVEGIGGNADDKLDQHVLKRLSKINKVRRFVATWVLLLVMLIAVTIGQTRSLANYYLEPTPVPGGTYTEGMVGAFTNANPLYATGQVDQTVSKLVFSGLLKLTGDNNLVGDLARSWEVNESGDTYTVTLKENLFWHDGTPLTANDIVFTFELAGHPDAKSPLFQTWRGVEITAPDDLTVQFKLKNPLSSFAYSLTTGIIPQHKLADFPPEQVRSASFNTLQPVGSGPFEWATIETVGTNREKIEQHIGLRRNQRFYNTPAKLNQFQVQTYTDQDQLLEAFQKQRVNAMVGFDQLPDELTGDNQIHTYTAPIMAGNYVFFQNENEILKEPEVRQALLSAVDMNRVYNSLGYPAILVDEPVLKEHFLYTPKFKQLGFDSARANKLLDEAGWKRNNDGQRIRKDQPLQLKIYAQNTSDFNKVSQQLQMAWEDLGVDVQVFLQSAEDLQAAVSNRVYDVLISGVTIGADPDVFVFWHSSQADDRSPNKLNFSHYSNSEADTALEAARTRSDPKLRKIKLDPFLKAWQTDVPGFGLYQPRFMYISRGEVYNFEITRVTMPANRLWNVQDWMIRQGSQLKQ